MTLFAASVFFALAFALALAVIAATIAAQAGVARDVGSRYLALISDDRADGDIGGSGSRKLTARFTAPIVPVLAAPPAPPVFTPRTNVVALPQTDAQLPEETPLADYAKAA